MSVLHVLPHLADQAPQQASWWLIAPMLTLGAIATVVGLSRKRPR